MSSTPIHQLIIIGSGPAGLTAAIYASRSNLNPLIIDGNTPGGQLMSTTLVENWPGEKSILGPKLMANMRKHAQSFGTQFIPETVTKVNFSQQPFTLWTNRDTELKANAIIVATGATPKKLGVPGEDEYWGKGITTCAICDGAFYPNKKVLIVGGGDTAMEDASFLKKFTKDITIVQVLDQLTASHAMQQRVINDPNINIIYNSTVTTVQGDGKHITGVTITNQKTKEKKNLTVEGLFIAIGLQPNSEPFKGQLDTDKWGYIKTINHTATSIPGIFVAGDVQDYRYRQAVTSAGAGCMAALDAQRFLESKARTA